MAATIVRPSSPGGPAAPAPPAAGPRPARDAGDVWPRTSRLLPWLLAAFLAMLWLVPFDSTQLRADFPVDLKLDRLILTGMIVVWLASVFAGGRPAPRWRGSALDVAVVAFTAIAVASILLNLLTLVNLGELTLATKKLGLLLSYVTFFFIVATTVRPAELRNFLRLFMALAALAAVGVLYDYFAHENLFFRWWTAVVPGGLVEVQPRAELRSYQGYPVVGPTLHGLALAGMFAMALGFAVVGALQSSTQRARIAQVAIACLYVAAVYATSRKTGAFASLAALGAIAAYRPREAMRYAPVAVALVLAVLLVRPTAVQHQVRQLDPAMVTAGLSGEARQSDYEHVSLDVREHLLTGRGYGSYDTDRYRILDNNYLVLLLETGLLGLIAMALVILAVVGVAHRTVRSRHPVRAGPALVAVGGAAAFATEMALFDALAFAQVPYMFFFLGGIAVVCRLERGPVADAPTQDAVAEVEDVTRPLPRLRGRVQRGRRRIARRRGGAGTAPRRVRRRGPAEAPAPAPAGQPHDPIRQPVRRRRRALPAGVRDRAVRARRSSAGRVVASVLALGLAVAAFGRGGDAPQSLPGLSAGTDVAGDDPFAAAPARAPRPRPSRAAAPPAGPAAPAAPSGATTVAALPAPGAETPSGSPRPRPQPPRREPRRPRPPRRPAPAGPAPATATATDPAPAPERDCLPGDVERVLVDAGLPRCPTADDIPLLEAVAAGGRLSSAELAAVVAVLRSVRG